MKLTYTKAHNLAQLAEELVAALPALVFVNAEGRKESRMTISGDGAVIVLAVPDGTAEASVAAVVNAHVVNANHGRDLPFEQAAAWLKGTAWPILQTTPPGALSAVQQNAYNKAMLVMVRRLFQELK